VRVDQVIHFVSLQGGGREQKANGQWRKHTSLRQPVHLVLPIFQEDTCRVGQERRLTILSPGHHAGKRLSAGTAGKVSLEPARLGIRAPTISRTFRVFLAKRRPISLLRNLSIVVY